MYSMPALSLLFFLVIERGVFMLLVSYKIGTLQKVAIQLAILGFFFN